MIFQELLEELERAVDYVADWGWEETPGVAMAEMLNYITSGEASDAELASVRTVMQRLEDL